MKAVLEYTLPDDENDLRIALDATAYRIILRDMDEWLRKRWKYDDTLTDEARAAFDESRIQLHALLTDHHIELE